MTETQPPEFPDGLYEEQAEYLAENTRLTKKEAEAYLRRSHIDDSNGGDVLDRELATKMGVSQSTFSKHLNNAREKLETDTASQQALRTMLLTTNFGGSNGLSRAEIGWTKSMNAFILLTETEFYDRESYSFPSKYKAHLMYPDDEPDVDFDAMPDSIIHYTKYSLFTIESSSKSHFFESVLAYVDALSSLNSYDLLTINSLLEGSLGLGVSETTDYAEDLVNKTRQVVGTTST
jgi:predicted DNA-binding protein (UPF0251 family)